MKKNSYSWKHRRFYAELVDGVLNASLTFHHYGDELCFACKGKNEKDCRAYLEYQARNYFADNEHGDYLEAE